MIILKKIKRSTSTKVVIGGLLNGDLDNSNQTFTTEYPFKPGKIKISCNGQLLYTDVDFIEQNDTTITLIYIYPSPETILRATYEKEDS